MREFIDDYSPLRVWVFTVLGIITSLLLGVFFFPRQVYDGFIWQYFWGPVVADGSVASCAVRVNGQTNLLLSPSECAQATGTVAYPGYTTISTISYAIILVLALGGVWFLLQRLDIGDSHRFFYSLVPFMLFGGALRTLEDANIALLTSGADPVSSLPWIALIISPFIYFTVFFITVFVLLISVFAHRRGYIDRYEYFVAAGGSIALLLTIAILGWLSLTTTAIGFSPYIPIIVLSGTTLLTFVVWIVTDRYFPYIHEGTGGIGLFIIWGHTLDGMSNVLSLDWASAFGLQPYSPKHVINRLIVDVTSQIQPQVVSEMIGTAWPFLFVKILAAVVVVWVFDAEIFEESPRYTILLLIAVLAVGIGPGTRDFLRATMGI